MTELSDLEAQITQLSKKSDEQTRITRSLIALCTTAIVGVLFLIFTMTVEYLPNLVVLKMMGSLDPIVKEWQQVERNIKKAAN